MFRDRGFSILLLVVVSVFVISFLGANQAYAAGDKWPGHENIREGGGTLVEPGVHEGTINGDNDFEVLRIGVERGDTVKFWLGKEPEEKLLGVKVLVPVPRGEAESYFEGEIRPGWSGFDEGYDAFPGHEPDLSDPVFEFSRGQGGWVKSFTAKRKGSLIFALKGDTNTSWGLRMLKNPPKFVVSQLSISEENVRAGEEVTVSVKAANTGGVKGSFPVAFGVVVRGKPEVEQVKHVDLSPGQTKEVSFEISRETPGNYQVRVEGLTGEFEVRESTGGEEKRGLPLVWIGLGIGIAFVLIVGLVFAKRS